MEKRRRIDSDRCGELLIEAGIAWDLRDFKECRRLLEKVLKIRSNHAEALERLAECCFRIDRFEEGLGYYERLREAPRWPPVTYGAAVAAWNTGLIEQCKRWAAEFLDVTRGSKEFPESRRAARELAKEAERRSKAEALRVTATAARGFVFLGAIDGFQRPSANSTSACSLRRQAGSRVIGPTGGSTGGSAGIPNDFSSRNPHPFRI